MGAIQSVDRKLVEVGRAFRLSDLAMVRRILLPAVLPAYVISLRSGLGLGWMFVVAAELMGASEGLGYLLIDGQQLGKPAEIVAAIVAFAIVGKVTDWLIALAAAPFLRWEDVVRVVTRTDAMLILDRVSKIYPNGVQALGGVSLKVASGEIVAVIGGSGCGKSTLLRAIGGLDPASEGVIALDGEPISAPHERVGIIFQEPRLLPWLKVADNVGFGLGDLRKARAAHARRCCADARRSRGKSRGVAARIVRRSGAARRHCPGIGAAAGSAAAR